jgi:site-specific DNA-cytosine methylase
VRIGSLFSGSGQLDEAVRSVLGGGVVWHSEIEPAAIKLLEHRYPGVPNLGDISAVDWAAVPAVDVLTGGFPCQDLSAAGKRLGLRPGTRSGLWEHMAYAIDQLSPSLVIIENVRGLLSAEAHSDMEPCTWCVGDGESKSAVRGTRSRSWRLGRPRVRHSVVWRTSFRRRCPPQSVPGLHCCLACCQHRPRRTTCRAGRRRATGSHRTCR